MSRRGSIISGVVVTGVLLGVVALTFAVNCAIASGAMYGFSGIAVPPDKSEFIGAWRATGIELDILPDGMVHSHRQTTGVEVSLDLPIQKFTGADFVTGVLSWSTMFHVTSPPDHDGDGWHMTADRVDFVR